MKSKIFLKEIHKSVAFWAIFFVACLLYLALYQIMNLGDDIAYLLREKKRLETDVFQNSLDIVSLQNFIAKHDTKKSKAASTATQLQKLLSKYSLSSDSLTVQENNGEVIYTIEDTTDYFLLQSCLFDLCRMHANVTEVTMKAEASFVHFALTISEK